jgi:hypothetical protein
MDIISRDVYLPLLSCNLLVSDLEKDRFFDLFHRLLNQTTVESVEENEFYLIKKQKFFFSIDLSFRHLVIIQNLVFLLLLIILRVVFYRIVASTNSFFSPPA